MSKVKYIIILLLLNCVFAQLKFDSGVGVEIADIEEYSTANYNGECLSYTELGNVMFLTQLRLNYKRFDIISNTNVYTFFDKTFLPSLIMFDSELGYNFNQFRIAIVHRCAHPIISIRNKKAIQISGGYDVKLKLHYNIK